MPPKGDGLPSKLVDKKVGSLVPAQMCQRQIVSMEGFTQRPTASVPIADCLNGGVPLIRVCRKVCRKCAIRFGPVCANVRLFNTTTKRFRAGLVVGKPLI